MTAVARPDAGAMDMVAVTTPAQWAAYHDIRRSAFFDPRGRGGAYDEGHPDDRAPSNHPFLLVARGDPVAALRVDLAVEPDAAVFRRVAVRAPLRRQGYGRELMRRAEAFAQGEGCRRFVAYVAPDAIDFWSKIGYRVVSHQVPGTDPRMEKECPRIADGA